MVPGSSAGKESACNAGDPGLIPGSGRSPGEGIGYPLQDFWVSLVAQTGKNPPAMQETRVWSLGWEEPLEEGMATHSSILACKSPWTEEPGELQSRGSKELDTIKHSTTCSRNCAVWGDTVGKKQTNRYNSYTYRSHNLGITEKSSGSRSGSAQTYTWEYLNTHFCPRLLGISWI